MSTTEANETSERTFGGLTPSEAGKRSAAARRKAAAERGDSAARTSQRTPLDALRDLMAADPEAYAAGLGKLVREGDPRSITIMRDLFQADKAVRIPRAEATIRAMSAEERRALLLELEARGATLPDAPMGEEASLDGPRGDA